MPPDALRGREHLLPHPGQALDVACGRGANAVWLARCGWTVDAIDVSGEGLRAGKALAATSGVVDRVRWWSWDLSDGLPPECAGAYDLVVCQRFRDPALYPVLVDRCAPGALLLVAVLSEVGDAPGPWRAAAGELPAAFSALDVIVQGERDGEASLLARRRAD